MYRRAAGLAIGLACLVHGAAVRIAVEVQDPRGQPFAESTKVLLAEWYPKTNDAIFGPGYPLSFAEVKVVFEPKIMSGAKPTDFEVPAYSHEDTIHVNSDYVDRMHKEMPDDYNGMMIHELTHIVQHYPKNGNHAGWLVEGIADYVRHKYFEKDIEPRLHLDASGKLTGYELDRNVGTFETGGYLAGYTVTGAFLYWLEARKDQEIVPVLNRSLRAGKYSPKLFQRRCGAPVESLWREFVAQSKAAK